MIRKGRKRCAKCGKRRLIKFFHRSGRKGYADGYKYDCASCIKKAKPSYVSTENGRAVLRAWQRRRKTALDELKKVPCKDCRERYHPCQMDFDHVRGKKLFSIAQNSMRAWSVLLKEIAKCDVVCANCHRMRTFRRTQRKK